MNGKNHGGNVLIVAKPTKPAIIKMFENLLWANSPNEWILKSTFFQNTLFVSMLIPNSDEAKYQKIRRSYDLTTIQDRLFDIYGLATDCIDEMKTELKK